MISLHQTRRLGGLACAVLAWGLLLLSASAQQTPPRPAPPPAAPASISGIVTAIGGDPIAGATVEARMSECGANGPGAKTTTTGEDGRFTLDQLAPGSWCVGAAHPSGRYTPAEYQQRDYEGRGVSLPLKEGQKAEIALAMIPTGSIAGRVFDVDGEPMARVRVQVMRASYRDGERRLYGYSVVQTDDRGDFRFFWLPADRYYIAATVEDPGRPRLAYSVPPPGQAGGRVDTISPYIIRRNAPTGEIIEETYRTVYYGGGLEATKAAPLDVRPGTNIDAISISLAGARSRAYHVRGTVIYTALPPPATPARGGVAPAAPAQTAPQVRQSSQIRIVPREWSAITVISSASADADGKFDLAGVAPGSYDLYVAAQGATARIPIEVGNNHVDNLRVTPVAPFKISGRLVVENPAAGTTTDFRNLRLVLVSDPDIAGIAGGSATATPSPEGVFTVSIQPGRYRAFAQPLFNPAQLAAPLPKAFENVYLRSIRLGATDVLADGLSISTAPEGQLEVVLGVSGSVSGMVTSEGRPVVNATVVLIPDVFRTRRDLYRVAKTDGSGKYQIKGVPPGGFKAFAWIDAREGQWYDPEFVRDSEGHGSPIQVSEGIATAADLPVVVR